MRKGSVEDVIVVMVWAVVIIISLITVMKIVNEIHDTGKLDLNDDAEEAMDQLNSGLFGNLDFIIVGLFFGMFIAMVINSLFLRTSAVYWVIGFFITIFGTIIAAIISNVYDRFQQKTQLASQIASIPLGTWLLNYLPFIYAVMSFGLMVVLYGVVLRMEDQFR